MLTDKFNQDPLEEHFSKQRGSLGGNENPDAIQYGETERKLQAAKLDSIRVMRGNTSGRKSEKIDIHDETPLPKRKKKDSQ